MSTKLDLSHLTYRPRNHSLVWDFNKIPFDEKYPNHLWHECMNWCKENNIAVKFDRTEYRVKFTNGIPNMTNIVHATFEEEMEALQFLLTWGGFSVKMAE